MSKLIKQLHSILSRRQRKQAAVLLVALIFRAGVELIGVASIAPFMSVVADPEVIHRSEILRWLFEQGGFASEQAFLIGLGIAVIIVLAFSNLLSALTTWAMQRFVWNANHQLGLRLLGGYLGRPYHFFVERNTASLHKNILSEVGSSVSGVLMPALTAIAQGLVIATMAGMLVFLDPILAMVVVLVLGGAYTIIYAVVRRRQSQLGRIRVDANDLRYKLTGEAFGGIKEVKVLQREDSFLNQFVGPSLQYSRAKASNATISIIPKYLLETLAFGGILLIVIYYLQAGKGVEQILPTISLYAFAGYRLMPALQTLFSAITGIRFNHAALDDLCADLDQFGDESPGKKADISSLPIRDAIRLENVAFRYPNSAGYALVGVSLEIKRYQTIGLVGASGSGKTTLVDLLLGLYEPEEGRMVVDEVTLDAETIPAWRQQVGYVPQHIFLSDDTIAQNIAFGVPPEEVDPKRVENAARIAHLHDFIQTLQDGYETLVGERGIRLSGGQRQRIGIARALYHDPAVLVMDEATSALDGATEDAVMEAIHALAGSKTIVLIAHRLTTVQECDCIYVLEKGRVVGHGTFQELIASNEVFRAMSKLPPAVALRPS